MKRAIFLVVVGVVALVFGATNAKADTFNWDNCVVDFTVTATATPSQYEVAAKFTNLGNLDENLRKLETLVFSDSILNLTYDSAVPSLCSWDTDEKYVVLAGTIRDLSVTVEISAPVEDYTVNSRVQFGIMDSMMPGAPEPATICLLGLGGVALLRRRRSK